MLAPRTVPKIHAFQYTRQDGPGTTANGIRREDNYMRQDELILKARGRALSEGGRCRVFSNRIYKLVVVGF
ncbi:unnamed protein product [Nippostrongylus brasiliensis]|uniref:Uncharacterized protein n=1 Tax=Nippostrongylus brasiliensis TaxID=27835 RepID=A0A0N4XVR9_NIPBR|nr:unnamed protein product [Nippostrongylus brasiliensis]